MTLLPRYDFDHSTPEGRAEHWRAWNEAPQHRRNLIGFPPCFTCGAEPVGTFRDGSPIYRHYHTKETQP